LAQKRDHKKVASGNAFRDFPTMQKKGTHTAEQKIINNNLPRLLQSGLDNTRDISKGEADQMAGTPRTE
jgi:hypothetical protein